MGILTMTWQLISLAAQTRGPVLHVIVMFWVSPGVIEVSGRLEED
jgi:hypothetical protein